MNEAMNETMKAARDALIAEIEEAFDGVPMPESLTLHVAEAHDEYDYDSDHIHRRKDFIGPWQGVPDEHIERCQCALSYVDEVGMRFYLPAYMRWYLRRLDAEEGPASSDNTLYTLDPHRGYPRLAAYHTRRFSLFTPAQLRACARFVRFSADIGDAFTDAHFAAQRYEAHWHRFDD